MEKGSREKRGGRVSKEKNTRSEDHVVRKKKKSLFGRKQRGEVWERGVAAKQERKKKKTKLIRKKGDRHREDARRKKNPRPSWTGKIRKKGAQTLVRGNPKEARSKIDRTKRAKYLRDKNGKGLRRRNVHGPAPRGTGGRPVRRKRPESSV